MNNGMTVSGGTIYANQIAVGTNAKAIKKIKNNNELKERGYEDVAEKIDILTNLLLRYKDSFENMPQLMDVISTIAEELKKDNPNKITVNSILEGLTSKVSSVANVANAVAALKTAIGMII